MHTVTYKKKKKIKISAIKCITSNLYRDKNFI